MAKKTAKKKTTVLCRLDLPVGIHRRLRAATAIDGRKMVEVVTELLDKHLPKGVK